MRTIEIEVSDESKALTRVSVVTLRSPRIGDIKTLPLSVLDPRFEGFTTVEEMLKVIGYCLDEHVQLSVLEQMEAQDLLTIYEEAKLFLSPSGARKIRRNGFPKEVPETSGYPEASLNSSTSAEKA